MNREDNGSRRRILTIVGVLAVSGIMIITGALGSAGFFGRKDPVEKAGMFSYAEDVAGKTQDAIEENFPGLSGSGDADTLTKDETVYVIMDADSAEQERVVNEWLRNPEELDTIEDISKLKDIRNTSGKETFEQDGKHIVWASGGNDIKYSGTTSRDLPVTVEVSYYLDGEYVTASEIAGQSGEVEIHFDYGINVRDKVVYDGKGYDLTHPYIMASGLMLDNEHFTDIEVSNGRVINESGSAICLGIALPGLQDDLALSTDVIDLPESVVIKAKTDSFRIDGTYTVALTGLLNGMDVGTGDVADKLDELESALGKLSKASSKLVKGSKKLVKGADKLASGTDDLSDGTSKLKKGSKTLTKGISKLKMGSKQLASGTEKIKKGAKSAEKGVDKLSDGLDEISSHSEELNDGTETLEENIFDLATEQLQQKLVEAGLSPEEAALFTLEPSTYKLVFKTLRQVAPEHTEEFDEAEQMLDNLEEYVNGVKQYTESVDEAAEGAGKISSGMKELTKGAESADNGAEKIFGGLSTLSGKLPQLKKGINQLSNGAGAIDNGADSLASGADELKDGIIKFDRQGIKKLANSVDTTEITDVLGRLDAISRASSRKHFVGGTPKEIAGESRIIFKTGAVEAE